MRYYLFKVNSGNTRTIREICSKLTITTPKHRQWCRSGIFIVNIEQISYIFKVFPLLGLNKQMPARYPGGSFPMSQLPFLIYSEGFPDVFREVKNVVLGTNGLKVDIKLNSKPLLLKSTWCCISMVFPHQNKSI